MQYQHNLELDRFIEASKAKGASDEFLADFLTRQGWPEDKVYAALGSYWEQATGVPVPVRTGRGESSRDAFLYLLSFATLATWSSALGSLLFRFIEHWFPDPVSRNYIYNLRTAVTWQMASIAVAFPIFLIVMRIILREAQSQPARLQSGVRKWLTYIALLLTAGGLVCDLIWFLNYFLSGELTSRFILKCLTVLLICGAIFVYYLGSLHWSAESLSRAWRLSLKFGLAASAVVAASFCFGLGLAGTPSKQRHIEADARRIQNLRQIAYAIHNWHLRARFDHSLTPLPPTLNALVGKGIGPMQIVDPETRTPYEYRVEAGTDYELCAVFSHKEEESSVPVTQFWHYGQGRTCFTLDAAQSPLW